jgi:ferrochelatase
VTFSHDKSGGRVDALLVLSFGGPEGPDDVLPFLRRVTRGRGVPDERLALVAEHYDHFGGVSPINERNRELIKATQPLLDLPVYFGNRNWHPFVEDTVAHMAADDVRRALVFATSAYGGYSACRQYGEDIARARAAVGPGAPELVKLRPFFDHPLFVSASADSVRAVWTPGSRLVFTAHSVPLAADAAAGLPAEGGHRYSRQVAEAAGLVAAELGITDYDVVWQSRSGPPQVPWLAPDIGQHLTALRSDGVEAVTVCPVGFVADHLEVVWDLDIEAAQLAAALGMRFARAATAGADPRFAELIAELVSEHTAGTTPRRLGAVPAGDCPVNGEPCAPGCCAPPQRTR